MSHFHQRTDEQTLDTKGNVIHWAGPYDAVTKHLLQPSQKSIGVLSQIKAGDRVLDVGCGSGRLTLAAQQWTSERGEAVGIDPSPEMIEVARQNAKRAGSKAKFELGLAESLPFRDASFDVVLNRLMLHHLPEDLKQRGLAEMRRVLKPSGVCLIVDFEPPKSGLLRLMVENHLTPMAHVDVRNYVPLLEAAGFTEIETGPTSSKLLSYVRGKALRTKSASDS
ncbi:MAG: class I SAM-dependent methyltransferase [Anaerolineales bacterium]